MSAAQYTWQSNDGVIPLLFEVQYEYAPASGLSPTVEVYRASDQYYADWDSQTFKSPDASGNRYGSMSESPHVSGLYQRNFNPVLFGQVQPIQVYYVHYSVTLPSGYIARGSDALTEALTLEKTETHFFTELAGSGQLQQLGMTTSFTNGNGGC